MECSVPGCSNRPYWVVDERPLCDFCFMALGKSWDWLKRELGAKPLGGA